MNKDIQKAIDIINESRETHVQWLKFQQNTPNWWQQPNINYVGDEEHHQKCINEYDFVIDILREFYNLIKENENENI